MTARTVVLAAALLAPAACEACAAGRGRTSARPVAVYGPPGADRAVVDSFGSAEAGRWETRTISNPAGGGERRYELYLPRNYDRSRQHMLVVLLHGCLQDPHDIARGTRIAEHADREGFVVLTPEQPVEANPRKCWNWFDAAHQRRDEGEPALIAAMTRQVMAAERIDPNNVHIAGISAGAAMAANVVIAYPELYASVAMHSGIPWRAATNVGEALVAMKQAIPDASKAMKLGADAVLENRERARAIPALIIQGNRDASVNPANARSLTTQWLSMYGTLGHPAAQSLEKMSAMRDSGETNGYHWTKASLMGGEVVELMVEELGHAWSGGSPEGTFTDPKGPDATGEIVRFFKAHPRK